MTRNNDINIKVAPYPYQMCGGDVIGPSGTRRQTKKIKNRMEKYTVLIMDVPVIRDTVLRQLRNITFVLSMVQVLGRMDLTRLKRRYYIYIGF